MAILLFRLQDKVAVGRERVGSGVGFLDVSACLALKPSCAKMGDLGCSDWECRVPGLRVRRGLVIDRLAAEPRKIRTIRKEDKGP